MYAGRMGVPDDENAVFRAVMPEGAHPELIEEEFALFRRLSALLMKRFPDIPRDRLGDLLPQARSEDSETAALAERLEELVATHRGSVIRALWERDEGKQSGE